MLCSIARELMSLYLDRELQPAQATHLMKHVYTCTACQHYQEAMEHVAMLLAAPPLAVPPAHFATRVMRRIHDEKSMVGKRGEGVLPRESSHVRHRCSARLAQLW